MQKKADVKITAEIVNPDGSPDFVWTNESTANYNDTPEGIKALEGYAMLQMGKIVSEGGIVERIKVFEVHGELEVKYIGMDKVRNLMVTAKPQLIALDGDVNASAEEQARTNAADKLMRSPGNVTQFRR